MHPGQDLGAESAHWLSECKFGGHICLFSSSFIESYSGVVRESVTPSEAKPVDSFLFLCLLGTVRTNQIILGDKTKRNKASLFFFFLVLSCGGNVT